MAQTAGGTYYAASSELVSSWPATSLDLANQLESRFAAKLTTPGAWTSYTPTLTAATTNPTLGTGSSESGAYSQIGKTVFYRFQITFGTSGVNAGSGTYYISLPVTAKASTYQGSGHATIFDVSTSDAQTGTEVLVESSNATRVIIAAVSGGDIAVVASGVPWTWAASDVIRGFITYEAA